MPDRSNQKEYRETAWPRAEQLDNPWERLSAKLGLVILWWSTLETQLDMHMWQARGGDWSLAVSFEQRLREFWCDFSHRYPKDDGDRVIEELVSINKMRNQLVHNVRSVGSMNSGETWFMCVRTHRNFLKAEKKWFALPAHQRGAKPEAFEMEQIPEQALSDMMSVIVSGLDVLRLVRENQTRP